MAQFDIYENIEPESKEIIPYLLDVQHDLHNNLATRTVIPLVSMASRKTVITKLCPVITVLGNDVMMSTPEIAGYPVRELGNKVMSASDYRLEILSAIDFLLSGF